MLNITRLNAAAADFRERLDALLAWEESAESRVEDTVREILHQVRRRGDAALLEYTRRFDGVEAAAVADLEIPAPRLRRALEGIPAAQRRALETAARRLRAYAEQQKLAGWTFTEADGTVLGQQVTPLDRVGLYVPGGKA
nr:histidinol dehydrogenase [Pseudomonadota bacterium]